MTPDVKLILKQTRVRRIAVHQHLPDATGCVGCGQEAAIFEVGVGNGPATQWWDWCRRCIEEHAERLRVEIIWPASTGNWAKRFEKLRAAWDGAATTVDGARLPEPPEVASGAEGVSREGVPLETRHSAVRAMQKGKQRRR
jgi:hypothetical protein